MNKDKAMGMMTYHTLRYLHRDKEIKAEFYACNSPEEIKAVIWKRMEPLFKNAMGEQQPREAFLKGIKLCDFVAIYEWLCGQKLQKSPTTAEAPQGVKQLHDVKIKQGESEVRLPYGE